MKKIYFLTVLLIIGVLSINAAQKGKGVSLHPGAYGMYVLVTSDLSDLKNGNSIELLQRHQGKMISIGISRFPSGKEEFISRIQQFSKYFPDFALPSEKMIDRLWRWSEKSNSTDSLYVWGRMPVVALSFGYMMLDTAVQLHQKSAYVIRVKDGKGRLIRELESGEKEMVDKAVLGKLNFEAFKYENDVMKLKYVERDVPHLATVQVFKRQKINEPFAPVACYKGNSQYDNALHVLVVDSAVIKPALYQYFVIPLDLYGLPGEPSDTVFCSTYDFPYQLPVLNFRLASNDSLRGIGIKWNPVQYQSVKSIVIERSEVFDSGFVKTAELPVAATHYVDVYVTPMVKYYYRLRLTGYAGEASQPSVKVFGMFEDTLAPLPPFAVQAEGVKNGVKISWVSIEPFIDGFYVYRSDSRDDSLVLISTMIPPGDSLTTFIDSSETLLPGKTYLYAVKAENTSHVRSVYSDTVAASPIKPENLIPPTGFAGYVQNGLAVLYWDDMRKYNETVMAYHLQRKVMEKGEEKVDLDTLFFADVNSYNDRQIEEGKSYTYILTAQGKYEESKPSVPVSIKVDKKKPLPPAALKIRKTDNAILLEWDKGIDKNVAGYEVYRYQRGKAPVLITSLPKDQSPLVEDNTAVKGALYFYYVLSVAMDGTKSAPSSEISVVR